MGMAGERSSDPLGTGRAGVLRGVNSAEEAVLRAGDGSATESRDKHRLAERFLAIARRRLFRDADGARLFARLALAYAGRVTSERGGSPGMPDHRDPTG
jgi:hypothetical protein